MKTPQADILCISFEILTLIFYQNVWHYSSVKGNNETVKGISTFRDVVSNDTYFLLLNGKIFMCINRVETICYFQENNIDGVTLQMINKIWLKMYHGVWNTFYKMIPC